MPKGQKLQLKNTMSISNFKSETVHDDSTSTIGHLVSDGFLDRAPRSGVRAAAVSRSRQGWPVSSGCRHGGQLDQGILAQRGDGFQRHVAGPLDGPFVILLQ